MSAPMVKMAYDAKARALRIMAVQDGREVGVSMDLPPNVDWAFEGRSGDRRLRFIAAAVNGCLSHLDGSRSRLILPD